MIPFIIKLPLFIDTVSLRHCGPATNNRSLQICFFMILNITISTFSLILEYIYENKKGLRMTFQELKKVLATNISGSCISHHVRIRSYRDILRIFDSKAINLDQNILSFSFFMKGLSVTVQS